MLYVATVPQATVVSSSVGGGESDSDVSVGRGDETYQPMAEDVFRYALRLASRKHTTS